MKNLKLLLSLVYITITTAGCHCPPVEYTFCNTFIVQYTYFQNIRLESTSAADRKGILVKPHINLSLEKRTYFYTCWGGGESYEGYKDLCQKHGDTFYRPHKIPTAMGDPTNAYLYCDFIEVLITSDSDYDSSHPAGQSLNDIIHFVAFSPNKFIRSGYKDKFDYRTATGLSDYLWSIGHQQRYYESWMKEPQPYHPIEKSASEITSEDLILLGHQYFDYLFWIFFEKEPDSPGTHNIKVTLHGDNGKVYENTVEVNF